ncbi:APC family permease [Alicyclobacillus pomorum]|uniref:APC family permease n=1 Tax=Alicyclobacillus pomorum TaxID=204470 RepID=UPI0004118353|nr:APC family permease [Alicyclobacillus pomorum]
MQTSSRQRKLHTLDAVALTVGSMVGAGIFSVLALTVKTAGVSAIAAWVLVVVLSLPMALTFSDLVGVLSQSGGPYVYIRDKSRPWLGLWTAWLFFVSAAGAAQALFIALTGMLRELGVHHVFGWSSLIVLILAGVTSVGIHMGALVQRVLTIGTVGLLVLCIVIGCMHPTQVSLARSSDWAIHLGLPRDVLQATFFAFWTYSGWEAVAVPSGAYKSRRSLAFGMIIGSLLVGVLYILVACSAIASVPVDQLSRYTNPLILVGRLCGPVASAVIGWGALVVVVGSLLSWLIATTTLVQATTRDGLLPLPRSWRWYRGEYHPLVPWGIALVLVLGSRLPIFSAAVAASSLTALIGYAVVFAVALFDSEPWGGVFRNHGKRRVFAALSLLTTVLFIVFSGWNNVWPALVLALCGAALLWLRRKYWSPPVPSITRTERTS